MSIIVINISIVRDPCTVTRYVIVAKNGHSRPLDECRLVNQLTASSHRFLSSSHHYSRFCSYFSSNCQGHCYFSIKIFPLSTQKNQLLLSLLLSHHCRSARTCPCPSKLCYYHSFALRTFFFPDNWFLISTTYLHHISFEFLGYEFWSWFSFSKTRFLICWRNCLGSSFVNFAHRFFH